MSVGKVLFRVGIAVTILAVGASATISSDTGNVLTAYIGTDDGIPLYTKDETTGEVERQGTFDLAALLDDILKTGGNAEMAADCMNANKSMDKCIDEKLSENSTAMRDYEVRKARMRRAVKQAERHGMHIGSVPFAKQFLNE